MTTLVMDQRKDVACDASFALRSIAILGQVRGTPLVPGTR